MSVVNYLPKDLVDLTKFKFNDDCPNCSGENSVSGVDFSKGYPIIKCNHCSKEYLLVEGRGAADFSVNLSSLELLSLVMNKKIDLLLDKIPGLVKFTKLVTHRIKRKDCSWGEDRFELFDAKTHFIPEHEYAALIDVAHNLGVKYKFITEDDEGVNTCAPKTLRVVVDKRVTDQGLLETITELYVMGNLPGGHEPVDNFIIPSSINNFKNLKVLYIDDLIIGDVDNIKDLVGLERLTLRNGGLSSTDYLKNLVGLKILELSCNKISSARGLDHLVNLERLILDVNDIERVTKDDGLWKLDKVNCFSIGRNKLVELSFFPPKLRTLRVFGNPCHPDIDWN